jgi:hypothetical protein
MARNATFSAQPDAAALDDPGHRSGRFGRWTYDLADHGVSAGEVRERFVGYRERFGV